MNKNLEELKELEEKDFKLLRLQDFVMYYLTPILEDFEKRLNGLEKFRFNNLGYYEINETGGVNDIKIGGTDPD